MQCSWLHTASQSNRFILEDECSRRTESTTCVQTEDLPIACLCLLGCSALKHLPVRPPSQKKLSATFINCKYEETIVAYIISTKQKLEPTLRGSLSSGIPCWYTTSSGFCVDLGKHQLQLHSPRWPRPQPRRALCCSPSPLSSYRHTLPE